MCFLVSNLPLDNKVHPTTFRYLPPIMHFYLAVKLLTILYYVFAIVDCPQDVVFIVDQAPSIEASSPGDNLSQNWNLIKIFLNNLLGRMTYGVSNTLLATVTYGKYMVINLYIIFVLLFRCALFSGYSIEYK